MSAVLAAQPPATMAQENTKAAMGFFSVLMGRGTANLKTEAQPAAAKPASTDARPAKPSRFESATLSAREQGRASFAAERGSAPLRSPVPAVRTRPDARREPRPRHTSGTAAFEAAVRQNAGALTERSNVREADEVAHQRTQASSMRVPRKDQFFDARDVLDSQDQGQAVSRQSRKVAFRTPTSSLHKGRGDLNLGTAGSSSESFHAPQAKSRPIGRGSKPQPSRSASQAEMEERRRHSSSATSPSKEQPRSNPGKARRANNSIYPFSSEPRRESFQATRASGPDRVIISPPAFAEDSQAWPPKNYSSNAAPVSRRPAPTPLAPPVRASQDTSRPRERPPGPQASASHRRAVSAAPEPNNGVREWSRTRSQVESSPSRLSMSTRPIDEPVAVESRSHSATRARTAERVPRATHRGTSNGLYRDGGRLSMGGARYSDAGARAQRV